MLQHVCSPECYRPIRNRRRHDRAGERGPIVPGISGALTAKSTSPEGEKKKRFADKGRCDTRADRRERLAPPSFRACPGISAHRSRHICGTSPQQSLSLRKAVAAQCSRASIRLNHQSGKTAHNYKEYEH